MTAGEAENAAAAAAQAAGQAAEAWHQADAQQQHQASCSTVVVEQASTPDDIAVQWSSADGDRTTDARPELAAAGQPAQQPSTRGVTVGGPVVGQRRIWAQGPAL